MTRRAIMILIPRFHSRRRYSRLPVVSRCGLLSESGAALLDKEDVAPSAAVTADTFAGADHAEPGSAVKRETGSVLRAEAGLHYPDPGRPR